MHTKISLSVTLPSLAMQEETKIDEGIQADENDDGGGDAASSASISAAAVVAARTHQTALCTSKRRRKKREIILIKIGKNRILDLDIIVVTSSEKKGRNEEEHAPPPPSSTSHSKQVYIEKVYFCFFEFMNSLYFIIAAPAAAAVLTSAATTTHNPKVIYCASNINTFTIIVVRKHCYYHQFVSQSNQTGCRAILVLYPSAIATMPNNPSSFSYCHCPWKIRKHSYESTYFPSAILLPKWTQQSSLFHSLPHRHHPNNIHHYLPPWWHPYNTSSLKLSRRRIRTPSHDGCLNNSRRWGSSNVVAPH